MQRNTHFCVSMMTQCPFNSIHKMHKQNFFFAIIGAMLNRWIPYRLLSQISCTCMGFWLCSSLSYSHSIQDYHTVILVYQNMILCILKHNWHYVTLCLKPRGFFLLLFIKPFFFLKRKLKSAMYCKYLKIHGCKL